MHDGVGAGNEQHPVISFGSGTDPKVFVATTVAALLLAGSAYVWRRGSGVMNMAHAAFEGTNTTSDSKGKDALPDTNKLRVRRDVTGKGKLAAPDERGTVAVQGGKPLRQDADDHEDSDDHDGVAGSGKHDDASTGTMSKSARAKERRRRGKDPLKELLKPGGGKLAKALKATELSNSSGTSVGPGHSRTPSQVLTHPRQSATTPLEGSNKHVGSSSGTVTEQEGYNPPSAISSQQHRPISRSRSRSRSITRNDTAHAVHEPSTTLHSAGRKSDAASTTSSASSSTNTEATTVSSNSTAPSSLTSSMSGGSQDADTTPKADMGRASSGLASSGIPPQSPSKRGRQHHADPWDWDGVGSSKASIPSSPLIPKSKPKSRAASTSVESSGSEGTPVPYSSVVSAKSPRKEDNRSTVGTRAETKEDYHSSSSFVPDAETLVEEEEEEAIAPLVFPSLNNPAPESATSAAMGSVSTHPGSLSRPHSRSSSSSGASSSQQYAGKGNGRGINSSSLAPFTSVGNGTPSGSGMGSRRVPTPLGNPSGKRPATPVGGGSAASSPLLPSNAIPPSPSQQSFGHHSSSPGYGGGATITVSAQTQVASLRGALEASRLREQKQKDEVEKVTKEKEALQWENAAWRRREVELQGQIQQMAHQLQSYAAFFSSMNHPQGFPQVSSPPIPPTTTSSVNQGESVEAPPQSDSDTIGAQNEQINDRNSETGAGDVQSDNDSNDISGGNSGAEKASGDDEGLAISRQTSSVPDGASASPAEGNRAEAQAESAPEERDGAQESGTKASTSAASGPPLPPPLITPINPAFAHAAAGGLMSPILHSPLGGFPHYGFGPHGMPMPMHSPINYPFGVPSPMLPHQQHPFGSPYAGGSAPQSPAGMMMPPQHNPFVVTPNIFHRPGTPGGGMMNGVHHPLHPHPHTPAAMGMGMGLNSSSPFMGAAGGSGVASGSTSPDICGSPSSVTALLMHDRSRRRMSSGSAAGGSGLARSLRGRPSILPLDNGIGRRAGGTGKSSSGSSVHGEVGEVAEGDGEGAEGRGDDEEDGSFNELLAGAILKRPESMRMVSRKGSFRKDSAEVSPPVTSGPGSGGGSASLNGLWNGYGAGAGSNPPSAGDNPEEIQQEDEQREFVFASLSDVGPVVIETRRNGSSQSPSPPSVSPAPSISSPNPGALPRPSSSLGTLREEEIGEVAMAKSDSSPQ